MKTSEGCASISTGSGRLLFYTDGVNIYDSIHKKMPNGVNLLGNISSTQSSIIVPYPDSPHLFYVICVIDLGRPDGLTYNLVDMRLDSGRGDVRSGFKNRKLISPVCEKLTAVSHSNGRDFWIISQKYQSDTIVAFKITSSGIDTIPVYSKTGLYVNGGFSSIGSLKVSGNGKKLVSVNYDKDTGIIAKFNASTGIASTFWKFPIKYGYGVEFSPNSKYVYITNFYEAKLYQFNALATSQNAFRNSRQLIDSSNGANFGALQLAPDNKIYMCLLLKTYLSCINKPDTTAPNVNFVFNQLTLSKGKNWYGLPAFTQSFFIKRNFTYKRNCNNDTTQFTITKTENLDSVWWNFGDVGSGSLNFSNNKYNVAHQYSNAGTYKVKSYFYYNGFRDSAIKNVVINDPTPNLGNDTAYCGNVNAMLIPNKIYQKYEWSTGQNSKNITINKKGKYIFKGTDSVGCIGLDTISLIQPVLNAGFLLSDTISCQRKSQIIVSDTSKIMDDKIKTYFWDFGDGTNSSDSSSIKHFSDSGNYTVKLLITSEYGCKDSAFNNIHILKNTDVKLSVNNKNQCFNEQSTDFSSKIIQGPSVVKYIWIFPKNQTDTSFDLYNYKFDSIGVKTVYFQYSNNYGCLDTSNITITIHENPKSDFEIDHDKQCFKNNSFNFKNKSSISSDSNKNYEWLLSDGFTAGNLNIQRSFKTEDTFKVRLIARAFNGCNDTFQSQAITFAQPSVNYDIPNDSQCWQKNEFKILNKTKLKYGILKSLWKFGDGTSDTSFQPISKYYSNRSDSYILWYFVTTENGCSDSLPHSINLLERPIAQFSINDSIQCFKENLFEFSSKTTFSAMNTLSYYWNYGDGDSSIGVQAKRKSYSYPGQKQVQLISYSYLTNCYDTITKIILPAFHPISDIEFNSDSFCLIGNEFISNNKSTITEGILHFKWDWGDMNTDTASNPAHIYKSIGNFEVRLISLSEYDCPDSINLTLTVLPHPIASFIINDSIQCENSNGFAFINQTANNTTAPFFKWILDTDSLSNQNNVPNFHINQPGTHIVNLIATSEFGCRDTIHKTIFIEKSNVVSLSNLAKDTQCYDGNLFKLTYNVNDPNVQIVSNDLYFGDNTKSINNPANKTYSQPGKYRIKIVTVSANNCGDTAYLDLRVLEKPHAYFKSDTVCFPEPIQLKSSSTFKTDHNNLIYWDLGDGFTAVDSVVKHSFANSGSHAAILEVQDSFGCKDTFIQTVILYPRPTSDFSFFRLPDTEFNIAQFQFNDNSSKDVKERYWEFSDGSNSMEINPIKKFSDTNSRSIQLIVTNNFGCKDTGYATTGTLFMSLKASIPDAFSPDGNGINDYFAPLVTPFVKAYSMEIYNRWGELVFKTNDPKVGWDGSYQNTPCEQGVYICRIYIVPMRGGIQSLETSVTLLR